MTLETYIAVACVVSAALVYFADWRDLDAEAVRTTVFVSLLWPLFIAALLGAVLSDIVNMIARRFS